MRNEGTPYEKPVTLLTVEFKDMPVRCFEASNTDRYHIILAQVPKGWSTRVEDVTFTDVSNAGFATTLGVASFHEQMNNKIDLEIAKMSVRRGRPKKVRTDLPGRPRNHLTATRIAVMESEPRVKISRIATSHMQKENEEALGSGFSEDGARRSKRLRVT
ncbi:hypothetical protein B0H14DRAFT_3714434 [Mycena olivaceomarginata]|nr:hypothetical protein B0H14DRAFT_3714434 [Mycena olivaceomarginata]